MEKLLGSRVKLLLLLAVFSLFSFAKEEEPVMTHGKPEVSDKTGRLSREFQKEIESGQLRAKTDHALDSIIKLAVYKLRRTHHKKEADKLLHDWLDHWQGYLLRRDIGDHKPLSMWLANQYAMLEMILGREVCHALRLDDLKIINFCIPVVFACVDKVGEAEYKVHFVPLMGTVSFWTTEITCVGGTWGTGFLWCSPIAMGVELLTKTVIAPNLNEMSWKVFCGNEKWGRDPWK